MGEQLPKHSADPETWNRLSAKLDMLDAEAVYQEKLQQLPIHSPDQGIWASISSRLNRAAYFKIGTRIALSAAAGLLLFFTVSRIADYYPGSDTVSRVAKVEQPNTPKASASQANPAETHAEVAQKSNQGPATSATKSNAAGLGENHDLASERNQKNASHPEVATTENKSQSATPPSNVIISSQDQKSAETSNTLLTGNNSLASNVEVQDLSPGITEPAVTSPDQIAVPVSSIPAFTRNKTAPLTLSMLNPDPVIPFDKSTSTSIMFSQPASQSGRAVTAMTPSVKAKPPVDPTVSGKQNRFALAMGYLPENMYNGTENTVFHNLDLTASYNKEKVRYNTSIGMAYNEDQFEVNMNYDIKSPLTAVGPSGRLDTLAYNSASLQSDYVGSEKHQYFIYNLGLGRRLFSIGKFSTWVNAGAGFGIKLNNPDLVSSTEKTVKNQFNAKITNINTSKPVYNDVNVNFVTGIDFNYQIVKRIHLSFTPTSRWYFKPVLSKNNQPTDELTLGFKTGIKVDF